MVHIGDEYYFNTSFSNIGTYSYVIWAKDTSGNINHSGLYTFVLPPNWDVTGDGVCNGLDVTWISIYWMSHSTPGWIRADITNDGWVNGLDTVSYTHLTLPTN